MESILVTGGTGFVGSHVCSVLLKNNKNIVIVDSLINSKKNVVDRLKSIHNIMDKVHERRITFVRGDIRNFELLDSVFKNCKDKGFPIKSVIHCAGLKAVAESVAKPILYWEENLFGTINLLKVMEKHLCFKIVFSSSATVYGHPSSIHVSEESPLLPINPYGETKLAIEKILNNLYVSSPSKWRIINLRYFNPIGAHSSGLIGEDPCVKANNIFPLINQVAIRKIKKIRVFGNNWPTPDGTGIRDYIHIEDLADGHVAALDFLDKNQSQFLNLNLGTGKGTSVLELITTFEKVNSCEITFEFVDRRPGDVSSLLADNKLALERLDWIPKRSIEDMCLDGWNWQKNVQKLLKTT